MRALILAGGQGSRLRPYTAVLPKPLMPVGDEPIIELLIKQLKSQKFSKIDISVGYLSNLIKSYCGDGSQWNCKINYVHEKKPLGTSGAIKLISNLRESVLVTNGDVLSDLNFKRLFDQHKKSGSLLTIAVYKKKIKHKLGVIDINNDCQIKKYREKPSSHFLVSTGIYCCSPKILDFIPKNKRIDLPDLVQILIKNKIIVDSYLHEGEWLDIGNHEDYEIAQVKIKNLKKLIFNNAKH